MLAAPIQTTLDLGIPLHQVTFCVVDLETTGGSPADCRITEVGAVKYLGGERIGSFQALVNPEIPIPPFITHLTGIDDRSVAAEPPIEEILPAFLEFCRGAVFVAHNARFDFSFLNANLTRLDYDPLPAPAVCTARLARRVRLARRPERQAADARALLPHPRAAEPSGVRRRRGVRRGVPRAARPRRAARHPHARRPARGGPRARAPALRQDPAWPTTCRTPPASTCSAAATAASSTSASRRTSVPASSRTSTATSARRSRTCSRETTSIDGETCGSELEALVAEARLIRASRAEVQPARQDVATIRVPQGRSGGGVPPAEGRARRRARRRMHVPRTVRLLLDRPTREGGARGGHADPPVHHGDARADAVRSVCPGRHGPVRRSVRRPRRSRALRRARPEARLLPDLPGRAPRSARTTHGAPGRSRSGTRRRGSCGTASARWRTSWRAGRADAWLMGAGALDVLRRRGVGDPVRRRRAGPRRRGRTARRSRAHVSAPTSSRPCAPGSARTTRVSSRATGRSPSPWTAGPRSPASRRRSKAAGEGRT